MRHFIVFLVLGVTAIVAGMTLAAQFAIPRSDASTSQAPTTPAASPSSGHGMEMSDMPDMTAISRVAKTIPDSIDVAGDIPTTDEVAGGAGRAFGRATRTVEHYSDQAFESTARGLKRKVEETRMPIG